MYIPCPLNSVIVQPLLLPLAKKARIDSPLKISSIGTGPGSDLVAMLAFLDETSPKSPTPIAMQALDLSGWADRWAFLTPLLEAVYPKAQVRFQSFDAFETGPHLQQLSGCNILLFSYFMPEMAQSRQRFLPIFDSIVHHLRPGTLLVFVDPHRDWIRSFKRYCFIRSAPQLELLTEDTLHRNSKIQAGEEQGTFHVDVWRRVGGATVPPNPRPTAWLLKAVERFNKMHSPPFGHRDRRNGTSLDKWKGAVLEEDHLRGLTLERQLLLSDMWDGLQQSGFVLPATKFNLQDWTDMDCLQETPSELLAQMVCPLLTALGRQRYSAIDVPRKRQPRMYDLLCWFYGAMQNGS